MLGTVLGARYRLERELGRGGMGTVYAAVDLRIARPVAVKVLTDMDPDIARRFAREAVAMGSLRHRHVVQVTDAAPDAAQPYYVMELLEGRSVHRVIATEGALSIDRAARIAKQILSALEAAHATVVHRDIKPANVMLVMEGEEEVAKLLDFGIAKALDDDGVRTTTGTLLGTPAYMAPEQILAKPVDARTDLHAVGLLLFEMLTAKRVFLGPGPGEIAAKIVKDVPPDVRTLRKDVPAPIAEAIAKALAKDPAHRFPDARAMRSALEAQREPQRRASPLLLGSMAAGATIVVVSALAFAFARRPSPAAPVLPPASPSTSAAPSASESAPSIPVSATASASASTTAVVRAIHDAGIKKKPARKAWVDQSSGADARTTSTAEMASITSAVPAVEGCLARYPNEVFAGDVLQFRKDIETGDAGATPYLYYRSHLSAPLATCLDAAVAHVRFERKDGRAFWLILE